MHSSPALTLEEDVDPGLDARALDGMLFCDQALTSARSWCHGPTAALADAAARYITACVGEPSAGTGRPGPVTVVDYGSGSGLAVKYLLRALADRGAGPDWLAEHVHLVVVDLPGPWFVATERLAGCPARIERRDLRNDAGSVLGLDEVVGAGGTELVLASMVLHLIPARALPRALAGIARSLRPGGRFLWTSPDSAPRLPGTVLFHDLNREVRARFCRLRAGGEVDLRALDHHERREVHELVGTAAEPVSGSHLSARRQIPDPSSELAFVEATLATWFTGRTRQQTAVITDEDLLRIARVPSNLKNLNEVPDLARRTRLVELLVRAGLPHVHRRAGAGRSDRTGVDLTWAVGEHTVVAS
jgi:SAM-dependent methyltransferase